MTEQTLTLPTASQKNFLKEKNYHKVKNKQCLLKENTAFPKLSIKNYHIKIMKYFINIFKILLLII